MAEEVKLKFSADTAEAISGIQRVKAKLTDLKSAVGNIFGNAFKAAAVSAGAAIAAISTALVKGSSDLIDFASGVKDVSDAIGISVRDVIIFEQAFEAAGISADKLQSVLGKLTVKIEGGDEKTVENLGKLGLNIDKLRNLDPGAQFREIAAGINGITDKNQQLKITSDLFGTKMGPAMARMIREGEGLKNAENYLGGLANISPELVGSLEALGDALGGLKKKYLQFMEGIAEQVGVENIDKLTESINNADFTAYGRAFAAGIMEAIAKIDSDTIYAAIGPGILNAIEQIVKEIAAALSFGVYSALVMAVEKFAKTSVGQKLLQVTGKDYAKEYIDVPITGKTWYGSETTVGTRTIRNPNYNPNAPLFAPFNYQEFRKEFMNTPSMEHAGTIIALASGGKAIAEISKAASLAGLTRKVAAGHAAAGATRVAADVGRMASFNMSSLWKTISKSIFPITKAAGVGGLAIASNADMSAAQSFWDKIAMAAMGALKSSGWPQRYEEMFPETVAKEESEDQRYVTDYFKNMRSFLTGQEASNQSVAAIFDQIETSNKEAAKGPRPEAVLGALARIGGATAEITTGSVVTYHKESLRYQREIAYNTKQGSKSRFN